MKNTWLALLAICILFSCKSKTRSILTDSVTIKHDSVISRSPLVEKFSPIIQGIWVISNYVDDLTKTRSPYKSSKKLWGNVEVGIDMAESKGDSVIAGLSLNNHEGSQFTILFKPGTKANCIKTNLPDYDVKTNFYELGYTIKGVDTSLVIYRINKKHVVIDSVKYIRVLKQSIKKDSDAGEGTEYITNKMLFKGNYLIVDSIGKKQYIEFSDEGQVYNFFDFKKYEILTDFVAGPANNLDQMIFDVYTPQQKDYTYKFRGDTLQLYDMTHNADSTLLFYGKLKYKLIKQK